MRLNKWVREQDEWTPTQIKKRGQMLARRALGIWPALSVDEEAVKRARKAEMRRRATMRDVSKVAMRPSVRTLFDELRAGILKIGTEMIEIAEAKSVSYYAPEFCAEVLPRARGLYVLLPLEFNEISDPQEIARDARQRKFIANAQNDGGTLVTIREEDDIPAAIALVRQAWRVAE